jgi:hypothetical protein
MSNYTIAIGTVIFCGVNDQKSYRRRLPSAGRLLPLAGGRSRFSEIRLPDFLARYARIDSCMHPIRPGIVPGWDRFRSPCQSNAG